MLRLFMGMFLDDPFKSIMKFLLTEKLGSIVLYIYRCTRRGYSEKCAFGHYVDGAVSVDRYTHPYTNLR